MFAVLNILSIDCLVVFNDKVDKIKITTKAIRALPTPTINKLTKLLLKLSLKIVKENHLLFFLSMLCPQL